MTGGNIRGDDFRDGGIRNDGIGDGNEIWDTAVADGIRDDRRAGGDIHGNGIGDYISDDVVSTRYGTTRLVEMGFGPTTSARTKSKTSRSRRESLPT
jgi:hypothetical protein